tara:strand:+ start:287 stop:2224 length:1938 start_codon:yes stop_codon:yes gene_type:complete
MSSSSNSNVEEFSITKSKRWTIQKLEPFLLHRPDPNQIDLSKPSQAQKNRGTMQITGRGVNKSHNDALSVFGKRLEDIRPSNATVIPVIIIQCIEYIRKNCMALEGIFRISAVQNLILETKALFRNPSEVVDLSHVRDHHVIACILKLFLREMAEPLFPTVFWDRLLDVYKEDSDNAAQQYIDILKSLDPAYMVTVVYVFQFLNDLTSMSEKNFMSAQNLGIVFGPGLLRAPTKDPMMLLEGWDGKIVEQMITLYDDIFPTLGEVCILEESGMYAEGYSGYIALAMSPRFSVKLQNTLKTKAMMKCELECGVSLRKTAGAHSFTIAVETNSPATDFLGQVGRRLRDMLSPGKVLALYTIANNVAIPFESSDCLYDAMVAGSVIEMRIKSAPKLSPTGNSTFPGKSSSGTGTPKFSRLLSGDLKGKLPPPPLLRQGSREQGLQLSQARAQSPSGARKRSPQLPRSSFKPTKPSKAPPPKSLPASASSQTGFTKALTDKDRNTSWAGEAQIGGRRASVATSRSLVEAEIESSENSGYAGYTSQDGGSYMQDESSSYNQEGGYEAQGNYNEQGYNDGGEEYNQDGYNQEGYGQEVYDQDSYYDDSSSTASEFYEAAAEEQHHAKEEESPATMVYHIAYYYQFLDSCQP